MGFSVEGKQEDKILFIISLIKEQRGPSCRMDGWETEISLSIFGKFLQRKCMEYVDSKNLFADQTC